MQQPMGDALRPKGTRMSKKRRNIITAIELGTHSRKVAIGDVDPEDGRVHVLGVGTVSSPRKIVKGRIENAGAVNDELVKAVLEAEKEAKTEIQNVFLAVSGGHIRTTTSRGTSVVRSPDGLVTDDNVVEAVKNARYLPFPPDQRAVNLMDRRYLLDGRREVLNPTGQAAAKLEAEILVVYGDAMRFKTAVELVAAVIGEPVADIVFSPIADVYAVVSPEDRTRGVLVIDIGAGVSEYALVHGPGLLACGQITVGCEHVANDLAEAFRFPIQRARTLLVRLAEWNRPEKLGAAAAPPAAVKIETMGHEIRTIPRDSIELVIDLRLRELFRIIAKRLGGPAELRKFVGGGVLICGGGARIPRVCDLARAVFGRIPVSVAAPWGVSADREAIPADPGLITPIGVLRYGSFSLAVGKAARARGRVFKQELAAFWDALKHAFRL